MFVFAASFYFVRSSHARLACVYLAPVLCLTIPFEQVAAKASK
jgi:hypothetical protein